MAEAKANAARHSHPRPLSPHLSIFRPYVNMTMSIFHRITGVANYMGSLLLAAWLISAAAATPDQFNLLTALLGSPIGLLVLFGFTWSVMHHMVGGLRHIIWDFGKGFSLPTVRLLSWGTLIVSLTLTIVIWALAYTSGSIHL